MVGDGGSANIDRNYALGWTGGAHHMAGGARYEITVDGKPRTNRDTKPIAIEAAEYLKQKNLSVEVTVRDRDSGEVIIIKPQPPILK